MPTIPRSVISLDVGNKRVGVALASLGARLPSPYTTLELNENFNNELQKIMDNEEAGAIVVGLPRGLNGQSTEQTRIVEEFVKQLEATTSLPVYLQDEAVTSRRAEEELESRGKPYRREDIDALAATYILEDWLAQNKELQN